MASISLVLAAGHSSKSLAYGKDDDDGDDDAGGDDER